MTTKQLSIVLAILIGLGVLVVAGQAVMKGFTYTGPKVTPIPTSTPKPHTDPIACTMDAMMCPDGSYVGRVAQDCSFALCPIGNPINIPSGVYEVGFNQKAGGGILTIIPFKLEEDSRCPSDVKCIQAGTVRVNTYLVSNGATTTQIMKLNTPMTFSVGATKITVTLTKVTPDTLSKKKITSDKYRFTFNFAR